MSSMDEASLPQPRKRGRLLKDAKTSQKKKRSTTISSPKVVDSQQLENESDSSSLNSSSDEESSDNDEEDLNENQSSNIETDHHNHTVPSSLKKRTRKKRRSATDADDDQVEVDADRSNCETGQIVKIDFKNFMCHRSFSWQFGRRLNFLSGRNGSGKSAVAVGVQLCLGGSSNSTGRGRSFKGLVREGHNGAAELNVTLSNEGADAYRPNDYGKRIKVKRILRKDGSSNYELRNEHNELISRDKSELMNITRALSIHVTNPCCVLTQEHAKVFIQGNSKRKYTFFMEAAGLSLLADQLLSVRETLDEAIDEEKLLQPKVQQKEQHMMKMKAKLRNYERLDELEDEILLCTQKAVWVDVRTAEKTLDGAKEILLEREEALINAQNQFESYNADGGEGENAKLTKKLEEIKERNTRTMQEQVDLQTELDTKRGAVREVQHNLQRVQGQLQSYRQQKAEHERRIRSAKQELDELNEQAKRNSEAEEREVRNKIGQSELELLQLREGTSSISTQRGELNNVMREKHEELNNLSTAIRMEQSQITRLRNDLRELSSGSQSKARLLHQTLPTLLERIGQRKRDFRSSVLGPIGLCTKIKSGHDQWGTALERVLGSRLRAFIVSNQNDHNTLYRLMREMRCEFHYTIIVQNKCGRYDVPSIPNAFTVADVLSYETESDDPEESDIIFNALVDQLRIERCALVSDENIMDREYVVRDDHGNDVLRDGILRCVTKSGTTISFTNGNRMPENMRFNTRNILASDLRETLSQMQEELQLKVENVQQKEHQKAELTKQINEMNTKIRQFDENGRNREVQVRRKEREIEMLKEKLQEVQAVGSIDTSHLEAELNELNTLISTIDTNVEQLNLELTTMQTELVQKRQEKEAIDQSLQNLENELDNQQTEINEINNAQRELKRKAAQMQKVVDRCEQELARTQREFRHFEVQCQSTLEKAEKLMQQTIEGWNGNRIEVLDNDTVQGLNKKKEKLKIQLARSKEEFEVQGFSKDELIKRVDRATKDFETNKLKWDDLNEKIGMLKSDVESRTKKYDKAMKQSFKKAKFYFDQYLQSQAFTGEILYNHEEKTMDLVVQTDKDDVDTKNNHVGNLSGGERSLVTFCFLLALGHVIESPFRIMDEYDVYMDETKRTISLSMLQGYIQREEQASRQFIVITPHTIQGMTHSNDLRILRMQDPRKIGNVSSHGLQQQTLD